ncbi:MAG: hypothetical protein KR126chlam6_00259 [Candidatus Anoxychlamydiales bacterium]|nr:hypothetical protein [Candidatus Anoxychlamydiales bacterium]
MKQLNSEQKYIDKILKIGMKLPEDVKNVESKVLISLLRKRLRMTQTVLAKKLGISQAYMAKIESGKITPSLSILAKIFEIMKCSFSIILIPEIMPDELLKKQALKAAKQNLKYIAGTMSLEDQLPKEQNMQDLLIEEQNRLLKSNTSKIWEINND